MENKKVFILLNDYTSPNPVTNFGVHLAKALDQAAVMLAIEKVPQTYPLSAIAGAAITEPPVLNMEEVKQKVAPYLRDKAISLGRIWEQVDYDVAIGFTTSKVISLTEERNPYLLVIEGRSDLTTLNEWFGTYETTIAEAANCPVLVVPTDYVWQPVKKILHIMEAEDAKVENMRALTDMTRSLKADLQVVLISEEETARGTERYHEMLAVFQDLLEYKDVTFHRVIGDKRAEQVTHLVDVLSADWLAFEQKSLPFYERVFNSYNTKRIILQSDVPVLVF